MINNVTRWLITAVTGYVILTSATNADDNYCTDAPQSIGPIITPCRNEFVLQKGQNFTLVCKGKRKLQFIQQEPPEEIIPTFVMNQTSQASSDADYPFETVLDLYNVNDYAIGYYACFDDTLNASYVLHNLTEEPNNTEHVSYIYIYVNGTDRLFAPMREIVILYQKLSKIIIECRPSTPDVEVTLTSSQSNKTPLFIKKSPKIGFLMGTCAAYTCQGQRGNVTEQIRIRKVKEPPMPQVTGEARYYLGGETFSLNCTVPYESTRPVNLQWRYPSDIPEDNIIATSNEYQLTDGGILYRNITITNATREHDGNYTCVAKNNCGEKKKSFYKEYLEKAFITLTKGNPDPVINTSQKYVRLKVNVDAYPAVNVNFLRNNVSLIPDNRKYKVTRGPLGLEPVLSIYETNVTDTANYTLVAQNKFLKKNVTFDVRIVVRPRVIFGTDKNVMENTEVTLICKVIGNPLPSVTWTFSSGEEVQQMKTGSTEVQSLYEMTASLKIPVHASGNITCKASNVKGEDSVTRQLLVHEIQHGFGVVNPEKTWFSQNDKVEIKCLASIYYYSNVTWLHDGEILEDIVQYSKTSFSHVALLNINQVSLKHAGNYVCRGITNNGSVENTTINITVAALRSPVISEPKEDINEEVHPFHPMPMLLPCRADGVPPPKLEWYKDGEPLTNNSNVKIYTTSLNHTTVNSTVEIVKMQEEIKGKYECVASSNNLINRKSYTLVLKAETAYTKYLSGIAVIFFALILLVVYLTCKVKKEKQFRKELAAAGLLYFKEGVTKSLNPDLGIDEQAELLPYDDKFEFPSEKLILGKQLGAGAFGVVYKAEARGIINAEETTPVAVKMVKKTADNMYIKALASELKIMVHLGKHVNIVNLLGACTKNVGKRELIVIVEYCKFGNIHNYMQRHREVFIDQLTDNKEKNLGKVNNAFSYSSGSTGAQSDYYSSENTNDTDHTFLNTANTNRSTRKVSEGYVQPEWRSNYESDYCFDGRNPRPLTSRDLLAWAFQIARGMEYLASRKVLHGDLAARNVLLAEDNIVKICDFGLAKSIYKNDEYQKKENSPLPVKWLAIECMTDRIFSTQSDVWSFGIVLWEMFSLAKTPYPNISPQNLLQWLSGGQRLEKPSYADDRLYEVMIRCWQQKPTARPTFSELQEILGTFLEDNVRNHYVDLNSAYMDMNEKHEGGEDYLAMVCAPDYNNLVTPSPHHYVNMARSFFPPSPTRIDEEGYLQMSPSTNQAIFSPRPQGTTFDFDARKFNSARPSDASNGGSELTPMLTLNNLPTRSGSESDHEGNASPYPNVMFPRIDEESDEVFETKHNNAKNALNNTAVTNPTYITFDVDLEKKPKDIINNYINVPNGLVK